MSINRKLYPRGWRKMSECIRFGRARGRCEFCGAVHGQPHPKTRSIVVLTVAHLGTPFPDGRPGDKTDKRDVRAENLAALCQACHFEYDRTDNLATIKRNRECRRLLAEPLLPGLYALARVRPDTTPAAGHSTSLKPFACDAPDVTLPGSVTPAASRRADSGGVSSQRRERRKDRLTCPKCGRHPDAHLPPWLDCPAPAPAATLPPARRDRDSTPCLNHER